jgi:hypothetical protein
MACVTPAKQDFRLVCCLINDDERCRIVGFNARMEADALPLDKMARHRRHNRVLRRVVAPLAVRDVADSSQG